MKKDTVIIGAGLVGSLLSIYLSKRGYSVKIYERRGDMRKEKIIAGRSINLALSDRGIKALEEVGQVNDMIKFIVQMRKDLTIALTKLPVVQKVHDSDANFLLVKMSDARAVYHHLLEKGIVVRDRSRVVLCEGCLRITVGTEKENNNLIKNLESFIAN